MTQNWRHRAACRPDPSWSDQQRREHVALFFPERGESHGAARAFCSKCPVIKQCQDYADSNYVNDGIWHGTTRSRGNWKSQPKQPEPEQEEKEFVIPRSLSATSIQVYLECPARWRAEYMDGARMPSGDAAGLGTVCHETFQVWVEDGHYLNCSKDNEGAVIKGIYDEAYWRTFSDSARYQEGLDICLAWVARQDWNGRTVVQTEKKMTFKVPTSKGEIDFNFIMDRLDLLEDGTPEVIDYKSYSQPIPPEKLKQLPQPRIYALGTQLMYPDAERIWMSFDLLRYDVIGVLFTREENRATWRWLCKIAERIVQDDTAEERLNDNCRWCVRKASCVTLKKHADAGGPLGITDPNVAARRHFELERAIKALEVAKAEVESVLLTHMQTNDEVETAIDGLAVAVTVSSRRDIDSDRVRAIVGDEVMAKYGVMSIGKLDKLLKSSDLDNETKSRLKGLVTMKYGDPKIKVSEPIEQVA